MARPGEESVRAETGKQIVWPTATHGGMVDLCAHHKRLNEGYARVENQIAAQTGLEQSEPESMGPVHGQCAECARNALPGPLNDKLKQELPTGYQRKLDQSDRTPRKPYTPGVTRTKPLEPLRQSENAVQPPSYDEGGQRYYGPVGENKPTQISSREFTEKHHPDTWIYRGVNSSEGAAATRRGQLGSGDYGHGVYMSSAIGHAQSAAHGTEGKGRIMRAVVKPEAHVKSPPAKVEGSDAINHWADKHEVDVVDLGNYKLVRNPSMLEMDERDYTGPESAVLDYHQNGYTHDEKTRQEHGALIKELEEAGQRHHTATRHVAKVTTYYHGTANEPPENESGYHVIPSGAHLHEDPKLAWHAAIKHWNDDESTEFPRVYRAHLSDDEIKQHDRRPGGLHLKAPVEAGEVDHDPEEHPEIKLEGEGQILYHGTSHNHEPDDEDLEAHTPHEEIVPGGSATHGHLTRSDAHAYATRSLRHAKYYADDRALNHGGTPHVYRVTPKNPADVEVDPMETEHGVSRGNYEHDKRSVTGFDVLDEVPPTRREHAQHKDEHAQEHGLGEYADEDDEGTEHWGSRHEPFEHAPGDTCSLCDNDWPTAKDLDLEKDAMNRKIAHDSGDSQRIFHCPFCGAGQVIGRSDGTTECEFCQAHFTVQVQPQFNSFPQTINGMPVQIPGMPGQNDALMGGMPPGGAPGAPGEPGNADPSEDQDNPFAGAGDAVGDAQGDSGDEAADGDDDKPDFLKSKSYRTVTGAELNEEQYLRHLAMLHAADHGEMAARLRRERA